jgi:hypothetical protein
MFPILYYNNLNYSGLKSKFEKVVAAISRGDFKSADVKKLKPTSYLRAKLDDTNRLLFLPIKHNEKTYLLILEVIKNHDYDKSRFLAGATINENNFIATEVETDTTETLKSIQDNRPVHLLDKFVVFDDAQNDVMQYPLPLIVIGSAGSGKTSVTLEKLKQLTGNCLYISLSRYLVGHTQKIYYSHNYVNDDQELDFLSFEEFLETIKIPRGKEITANNFMQWFSKQPTSKLVKDGRKLFEELRGVITGSDALTPYLDRDSYYNLGIKQSIYLEDQRPEVYRLFEKYLALLSEDNYHDSNIVASEYQKIVNQKYDAIVIDEVQDFTNSQLSLVLNSLKEKGQFLLCGDANQIVHPNFFSWSKLKSYFHEGDDLQTYSITRILTKNYRNTPEVTELANRVLRFKNYRFGSVDKESHYLVECISKTHGQVSCLESNQKVLEEFNEKTSTSINYAILVLHENDKAKASREFNSPLIFTVQEAKGLEYENIILYNFVSSESRYEEIAKGMDKSYLSAEFEYGRAKKKTDKSLETYKFYVNSLYVAITRSVKNVYIIEDNPQHKFLKLLEINEIKNVALQTEKSSENEWQKEASKLVMQGKDEQAQAIEDRILQRQQVPWEILDVSYLEGLIKKAFVDKSASKKEQIKLLNYAVLYNDHDLINRLRQSELKAAKSISKSIMLMEDQYFSDYAYRNNKKMHSNIKAYGLEFKNQFNLTPLMCAAYMGNELHVKELLELGANLYETDNKGRTPLMIAMSKSCVDNKYAQNKLPGIYNQVKPDSISVQIDNRLIKIDPRKAEFLFLLHLIAIVRNHSVVGKSVVFSAGNLSDNFSGLSSKIVPEFRKRRTYVSSILSKNEIDSKNPYSCKLFKRVKIGFYIINPEIKLRMKDNWVGIND